MMNEIYLDNAAATKMGEEVVDEMKGFYSEKYGNPSSFHYKGLEAKNAILNARLKIAKILNCESDEIIFTGGGTESINLALKGVAFANKENSGQNATQLPEFSNGQFLKTCNLTNRIIHKNKKHIITSKIEHPAVLNSCKWLEKQGFEVSYVNVDKEGIVIIDELIKAIRKDTLLISVMYANNEIGSIQPIEEIGKIAQDRGIYFHSDGCQAAGTLPIDVSKLGVDLLTLNAGKIYGPKGVGLLYVKKGVKIEPWIQGGEQEKGLRAGTENVPGIVGFAKALEIAQKNKEIENKRLVKLRDRLTNGLLKIKDSRLNGHGTKRLPNNVNISFFDVEGESILLHLNEKGIFASTGSACSSHSLEPSHVLIAIGLPHEVAHGSIRFSLGRETNEKDIDYVIKTVPEIINKLRKISPVKMNRGGKI